jgi:hypothetical protein
LEERAQPDHFEVVALDRAAFRALNFKSRITCFQHRSLLRLRGAQGPAGQISRIGQLEGHPISAWLNRVRFRSQNISTILWGDIDFTCCLAASISFARVGAVAVAM